MLSGNYASPLPNWRQGSSSSVVKAKDRKAFEMNHKKIVIFMYGVSRIIVEHLFIEMHFKFYEFIFNCLSFITF